MVTGLTTFSPPIIFIGQGQGTWQCEEMQFSGKLLACAHGDLGGNPGEPVPVFLAHVLSRMMAKIVLTFFLASRWGLHRIAKNIFISPSAPG